MATEEEAEYRRIRRALKRAVLRICPPWLRDQSDDLVQVGMLRLMEIQRRSAKAREFSTSYLRQVAYSALIDEIRKRRTRQEVALEDEEHGDAPTPRPNPEQHAAGRAIGEAILACIATLVDTRRRAVTLYLRGTTAPRMAELMGWSRRQAENLVLRGRKDLQHCLSEKGWEL